MRKNTKKALTKMKILWYDKNIKENGEAVLGVARNDGLCDGHHSFPLLHG